MLMLMLVLMLVLMLMLRFIFNFAGLNSIFLVSSGKMSAFGPDGETLWDLDSRSNWRQKYIRFDFIVNSVLIF
jgi:hypothetical protein